MNSLLLVQNALLLSLLFLSPYPSSLAIINQNTFVSTQMSFLQCLRTASFPHSLIFTPTSKNYTTLLFSSIQNLRTLTKSPKPLLILTPTQESHIQSSVSCSEKVKTPIRVRSGGHDFEGLSYASTSTLFFIIVDLQKLNSVTIDSSVSTAWVQAGATLGELYYAIAMKSRVAAFPAGSCLAVGVGGHFAGGGMGTIMRAHGLSVDNIVDARIVNAKGDVLDRESMGENHFWALRGGGGSSFGIILSYRIKLVPVPAKVTVFCITKTLSIDDTIKLFSMYQKVAYKLDKRIYLQKVLNIVKEHTTNNMVQVDFNCLFLGGKEELLSLMEHSFRELELKKNDCAEMSWIESVLYFAGHNSSSPLTVLFDKTPWSNKASFKSKSDILTKPISEQGWREILVWLLTENRWPLMIFEPLEGRVGEISETDTPFPHRKGSLYNVQYIAYWIEQGTEETNKHLDWMRRFYGFMAPHVSGNPRGVYVNYRDLDLGVNDEGNSSFEKGRVWGEKYFKGNFRRLAKVKSEVDSGNLFRNEQSIPLN